MYKEVNRSLIKWPVAASATMLAISWFALDDDVDNVDKPSSSQVSRVILGSKLVCGSDFGTFVMVLRICA